MKALSRSFTTLLFLCVSVAVFSQSKSILRMGEEETTSFNDNWYFKRFGLQPDGNSIEEPKNLQAINLDETSWRKLNVPHDWGVEGPFRLELTGETGKLPWRGIGWYRKKFSIEKADANKKIYIDFDGAMAYAQIWLNEKYVGTFPYGYSSFRMDLTPYLTDGDNVLAVRLDTEKWDSRWYPGAGIYRNVWLVKSNPIHIAHNGVFIASTPDNKNKAEVLVQLEVENNSNNAATVSLKSTVYEISEKDIATKKVVDFPTETIPVGANEIKKGGFLASFDKPKLWSVEHPNRYLLKTELLLNGKIIQTYNTTFGVRSISFSATNGFHLNGKRVEIKGVCLHHDLGALGATFNLSALKRQLIMMKEMGCNSIRTSHNPPAPELLDLADKMGFLVWDETFDTWAVGKKKNDYNKIFEEWHERDIKALVERDRNHPSVFIWSIGNEVPDQRNVELTKKLVDIMKKYDTTRPVSNGYNDPDGGRESGAAMSLDIMGVNYFFGQQPKWDAHPNYKDKPTVGSETSSCVSSRGEYFFGEDYKNWQISSYDSAFPGWGCSPDTQFRTNASLPNLLGEYVWTGFDYLGEPTPYNSDETNLLNFRTDPTKRAELEAKLAELKKTNPPSRSSYFGIIDLAGFKKDRFYSYQSHWINDKPVAHLFPHWNWSERLGQVTPVHLYTSGDEAELFLNGVSQGRKKMVAGKDFRLIWDKVVYAPGELKAVVYKKGKAWATDVVKTTGEATQLKLSANTSTISSDGNELCFVTIAIADKDGTMVPRTHNLISVSIEGEGEIVATDNGDATSFVPFQATEKQAYNGLLLAIVKSKSGKKGSFKVTAKSEGLKSATFTVVVE